MRMKIVELRTERNRDGAVITAIAESTRGTKFRYRHVKVLRKGKTRSEYQADKAAAIEELLRPGE